MSKKRILLVDDDAILGEIITKRIEEEGYECFWEKDGSSGLAKLRELKPDLLLLDIVMPTMNGYEVLEAMNREPELLRVPVVVISNSGQPVEVERILGLGVRDYIVKAHFSPEEVLEKITTIIGSANLSNIDTSIIKKTPQDTKILIVEDEAILLEIATDRFKHAGYQAVGAPDGIEGLAKAEEIVPDLILLDLLMPGISGFEVLKRLKANEKLQNIPVVIFSNLAQSTDIAEAHRLGAVDFLVKANFTPSQLVEHVKEVLAKMPQSKPQQKPLVIF